MSDWDSEGDNKSVLAQPPANLIANIRGILPEATRSAILTAFDRISSQHTSDDARLHAVIDALMNDGHPAVALPTSSPSRKRKDRPIHIDCSDSDNEDDERPAKRQKGKGRAQYLADSATGASTAQPVRNMADEQLAYIIAIFPDIDHTHAKSLIANPTFAIREDMMDAIAEHLFSTSYPKAGPTASSSKARLPKSPRKQGPTNDLAALDEQGKQWLETDKRAPPSIIYRDIALAALVDSFPRVPKPYIRTTLLHHRNFYAPAYLKLQVDDAADPKPFVPLIAGRKNKGKDAADTADKDFDSERDWLVRKIAAEDQIKHAAKELQAADAKDEAAGHVHECSCCYSAYVFRKMAQCADGHLFCLECAKTYVKDRIGGRQIDLVCMHEDGCSASFPDEELKRFMDEKSMDLLDRLRQDKYVERAQIDNLDRCPFCPFAIIIDNEHEKLFTCANEDCMKVSCRQCKKLDHLPKSCKEVEADELNSNVHRVEEAMSAALIRKCPKCQQPFVKSDGCNKMVCSNCHALSCFICQKLIKGYDHFADAGRNLPVGARRDPNATCPLFDDTMARTHKEVETARLAAAEEARKAGADQAMLDKLALEKLPPRAAPLVHQPNVLPPHINHDQYAQEMAAYQAQNQVAQVQFNARYQAMMAQAQVQREAAQRQRAVAEAARAAAEHAARQQQTEREEQAARQRAERQQAEAARQNAARVHRVAQRTQQEAMRRHNNRAAQPQWR